MVVKLIFCCIKPPCIQNSNFSPQGHKFAALIMLNPQKSWKFLKVKIFWGGNLHSKSMCLVRLSGHSTSGRKWPKIPSGIMGLFVIGPLMSTLPIIAKHNSPIYGDIVLYCIILYILYILYCIIKCKLWWNVLYWNRSSLRNALCLYHFNGISCAFVMLSMLSHICLFVNRSVFDQVYLRWWLSCLPWWLEDRPFWLNMRVSLATFWRWRNRF